MYYEEHGSPSGIPVVVLHGGPGGGLQPSVLNNFDLKAWRVILYDQRGCGASTPKYSTHANTTWHLVADMERLRSHLGLERWVIFGGSWGTTLALAYASRYAERVRGMILRGVCLLDKWEQNWLYRKGGASQMFPREWASFEEGAGSGRGSLMSRYTRRLRNRRTRRTAARAWWGWEAALSTLEPQKDTTPISKVESLAVLENHYFSHNAWLRPGQLLAAARRFRFPINIVQGRYDMVCPPAAAHSLSQVAPHATIQYTLAGHAASEPATAAGLRAATDALLKIFINSSSRKLL